MIECIRINANIFNFLALDAFIAGAIKWVCLSDLDFGDMIALAVARCVFNRQEDLSGVLRHAILAIRDPRALEDVRVEEALQQLVGLLINY